MSDDLSSLDANIDSSLATDALLAEMELETMRRNLAEITDTRKAIKEAIQAENDKSAKIKYDLALQIKAEEDRARAATAPLSTSYNDMHNDEFDAKRALREAERKHESMLRQIDQARRAALKSSEWATLENRWDLLTMGAPWREWAKDHQISGAKKMTYEGRMILGDTMGLGKTLTSLIAIDMIQAATKDASPDNPVQFGSAQTNEDLY